MDTVRFVDPQWLLLFLVLPLLGYRYAMIERRYKGSIRFSSVGVFADLPPTVWNRLRHGLPVLKLVGLSCLIIALARPQAGKKVVESSKEGIDIMLTLDVSGSMASKDLSENGRLHVAKVVVADFIGGRQSDRIGLVVFAEESFTQCPLTLDYDVLLDFLDDIRLADQSWGNRTAIGMALVTACNRLRDSEAESKIIVLLTDGANNAGEIDPQTATDAAAAMGIKVYTIGIGRQVSARATARGAQEFDQPALMQIAARTGGKYYHATSREKLEQIYREIGELETTEISSEIHLDYSEGYANFAWMGTALLLTEMLLANTRFRRIP